MRLKTTIQEKRKPCPLACKLFKRRPCPPDPMLLLESYVPAAALAPRQPHSAKGAFAQAFVTRTLQPSWKSLPERAQE